jgi:hypothetical protein
MLKIGDLVRVGMLIGKIIRIRLSHNEALVWFEGNFVTYVALA